MDFQKTTVTGPDGQSANAEIIPIQHMQESQATYLLADGTTLSMRTVVVEVVRLVGQFDNDGNPAYFVKSQNIVTAKAPSSIKEER